MMKRTAWIGAALATVGAALATVGAPGVAAAASHREAPAISRDPTADNTDLYAWVQGQNLVILANYIPFQQPAGGPNFYSFSDDVLYEVHIARGPSSLEDAITYQIRFTTAPPPYNDPAALNPAPAGGNEFFSQLSGATQTYTVTKIENGVSATLISDALVVPPSIGPRTNVLVYETPPAGYPAFSVSSSFVRTLSDGEGRVWAGPRDDPFYADLGHLFDLGGLCTVTVPPCTARNHLGGFNVHSIALEIPLTKANGGAPVVPGPSDAQTLGIWASASRRKVRVLRVDGVDDELGPWVQVSRAGLPLINETIIGLQDKDKFNRSHPRDDLTRFGAYILNPILVRDAEFAGFYATGGPLEPFAAQLPGLRTNRGDIVSLINLATPPLGSHAITTVGDVLRVDLGVPSAFPNGRALTPGALTEQTDVTDVALTLILTGTVGTTVSDGVSVNDRMFLSSFPFLPPPREGAGEGHHE